MNDRSEYYKNYYEKNREKILLERRKRYKVDPEYREKVKNRFRRRYDQKLRSPDKEIGYTIKKANGKKLFTIRYASEMTGLSASTLRRLEQAGIVPKSLYTDSRGWRLYTEGQIKKMAEIFSEPSIDAEKARKELSKGWAEA